MSNDLQKVQVDQNLVLGDSFSALEKAMPEHSKMFDVLKESMPEINRASSLFFKTQSQFMDNMMTVSHNTPIRNLRQILAQMNRTIDAIREANFKLQRKEVEIKIKEREREKETDDLKAHLLDIDILELSTQIQVTRGYLSGAVRVLTNYTEQYNSILKEHKLDKFNEADFEREEEKYHIMKAFEQAMCAARSNNGVIDTGNMIYLTQIGINGCGAQREITQYLRDEMQLINQGKEPTYKMYLMFLERMAKKYQGSAEAYAKEKGMKTLTEVALLQKAIPGF